MALVFRHRMPSRRTSHIEQAAVVAALLAVVHAGSREMSAVLAPGLALSWEWEDGVIELEAQLRTTSWFGIGLWGDADRFVACDPAAPLQAGIWQRNNGTMVPSSASIVEGIRCEVDDAFITLHWTQTSVPADVDDKQLAWLIGTPNTSIAINSVARSGVARVDLAVVAACNNIPLTHEADGGLVASWSLTSSAVTFSVSAPGSLGWLALGFNVEDKLKMEGTDAIIGRVDIGNVMEYRIDEESSAGILPFVAQELSGAAFAQVDGRTQLNFTRPLTLASPGAMDLSGADKEVALIWAYYSKGQTFRRHDNAGAVMTNLRTCETWVSVGRPAWVIWHGVFMGLGVGIVLPLAALLPRACRAVPTTSKLWFSLHRGAMVAAALCVYVGFAVALKGVGGESGENGDEEDESEVEHYDGPHGKLGLIIVLAITANLIVAAVRPAPAATNRTAWLWVHRCVGAFIACATVINVLLGLAAAHAHAILTALYVITLLAFTTALVSYYLYQRKLVSLGQHAAAHATSIDKGHDQQHALAAANTQQGGYDESKLISI